MSRSSTFFRNLKDRERSWVESGRVAHAVRVLRAMGVMCVVCVWVLCVVSVC